MATKSKRPSSLESKFLDLATLKPPLIITLYGRAGTGKTTLLSTFPKPLLLIDVRDKGTDSAKSPGLKKGDITVFRVNEWGDAEDLLDWLMSSTRFKSVGIDHLTKLQDLCMASLLKDGQTASQRQWGEMATKLKSLITGFCELSENDVVPAFLAQERIDTVEDNLEGDDQILPAVGPACSPSVQSFLCATSRIVAHTYLQENVERGVGAKVTRNIEYRLRTGPSSTYITKFTKPKASYVPPYIRDAKFEDILKIAEGKWEAPKTAAKKKMKGV
jgi:hypothetical protein